MASPPLELLHKTTLCRALNDDELRNLASVFSERSFQAGETLFAEGAPGDSLLVVLAGEVEVLKKDQNGVDRVIANIGEGAILGEMSLIAGEESARTASARATSAGRALALPSREFQRRIREGDVAALKVVYSFAQILSRRLLAMNEQVVAALAASEGRQKTEMAKFNELLSDWSF